VLASYLAAADRTDLHAFLDDVFATAEVDVVEPDPDDVRGYTAYLDAYRAGLAVERAAVDATPAGGR
jgi:hypothetical protein